MRSTFYRKNSKSNLEELWNRVDKKNSGYIFWEKEKSKQAEDKNLALDNAKQAAYMSLPLVTMAGIEMMGQRGDYNLSALGLPIAVGGVIIDTVKAPFCLVVAGEEAIRGGIGKLCSLLFAKSPTQKAIDNIFKSFLIRMRETATLLTVLGLEEENVLDAKLKSGDIEELVGLTLLHSAYASRHYDEGLLLASQKKLTRDNCPQEGLQLFNGVMELKKQIIAALKSADDHVRRTPEERDKEESRIVCQWIKHIKAGNPIAAADKPDATEAQLAIVNEILNLIHDLKKIGMDYLPESSEKVVSHLPKPMQ